MSEHEPISQHSPTLDIERLDQLEAYLRMSGRVGKTEGLKFEVLRGGVSNRTVWVERADGQAWVLKQALAKLRVEVAWFSDPARIRREVLGLRWLATLTPGAVTPLVFEDPTQQLFAMQALPKPHANWKDLLLAGKLLPEHVRQFGELLGTLHRGAYERRSDLVHCFEDRSFFESLRLEPYYAYTADQVPKASGFLHSLIDETRTHRLTLVHGDYSPKNVLIREGKLVLLDHEVIHLGDPSFDVGFGLTHLLSKAHYLRVQRAAFADAARAFWLAYRTTLGEVPWLDGLEVRVVRQTLGCLLARVAGRSRLEYLSLAQRQRQADVVLELMTELPPSVESLTTTFARSV